MHTDIICKVERDNEIVLVYHVDHDYETVEEMLTALRAHITAWSTTQAGLDAYHRSSGDFNWGDLAGCLDAYGFRPIPNIREIFIDEYAEQSIVVDHDEWLMPNLSMGGQRG